MQKLFSNFHKPGDRAKTLQMLFSGLIYYLAQFLHQLLPNERFTRTEVTWALFWCTLDPLWWFLYGVV